MVKDAHGSRVSRPTRSSDAGPGCAMILYDRYTSSLHITAKADCLCCYGEGYVYDLVPVPFGSGNCPMPSLCSCVEEQIPEEADDEVLIVVVPAWKEGSTDAKR